MLRSAFVAPRLASTLIIVGALFATGCAATTDPSSSPSPSTSTAASTATATATPVLVPDGTAADNLPLFTEVMNAVAATDAAVQGRAYIDALVAAGFEKADMEVTNDLTSVGNPADSIQFSVRWGEECLVGQVGPSIAAPTALVMPIVPGGTCLIGQTRTIDW
ncbi:MAG: hypothetical protein QM677_08935 [Microbacterium sp.]